ncbi:MAG: hypothetical protein M0Z28_09605 [Rhodospirillales bacterium]|nr:hypothetical protein [Rhodospirillales bacterium]
MTRRIEGIRIEFIDHAAQRYPTAGDWFFDGDVLVIRVSRTADERHQQLVAMHELAEALICVRDGVTAEAVDAFDMGPGATLADPGNSPDAPYHAQHMVATAIERVMASALGVEWGDYDAALEGL